MKIPNTAYVIQSHASDVVIGDEPKPSYWALGLLGIVMVGVVALASQDSKTRRY